MPNFDFPGQNFSSYRMLIVCFKKKKIIFRRAVFSIFRHKNSQLEKWLIFKVKAFIKMFLKRPRHEIPWNFWHLVFFSPGNSIVWIPESHSRFFLNSILNSQRYSNSNVVPQGLIPCKNFREVLDPADIHTKRGLIPNINLQWARKVYSALKVYAAALSPLIWGP